MGNEDDPTPEEATAERPPAHCFTHGAMNTLFQVFISLPDREYARQAAKRAFRRLDGLEQELSRFVENSDVSRLCQAEVGERVILGESTVECLQLANRAYLETGGAFDVTLGSGMESILLDPENMAAEILAPGLRLDFGAIGKGYAIDCLAEEFLDWEIRRFLVHGGQSSVLALDPPEKEQGWGLRLSWPADPPRELLRMEASHIVFSGSGLEKGGHIINPRTGNPLQGKRAVWVWADRETPAPGPEEEMQATDALLPGNAAMMDALSTAFMVMPPEEIAAFHRRHPRIRILAAREASAGSEPVLHRFGL